MAPTDSRARDRRIPDGRTKGLYHRVRKDGSKAYFYSLGSGRFSEAFPNRGSCIEAQARHRLRRSAGMPPVDTRVRMSDLIQEVRASRERNARSSTLVADLRGLEILEKEVGHFRPGQLVGSDRLDRLVRDLSEGRVTGKRLSPGSVKRYLAPLGLVSRLAVRRGVIQVSLMQLIEWPRGEARPERFKWSRESISKLLEASRILAAKSEARYDYSPLMQLLVYSGLRIGEALALRVEDVDLLGGRLHVRHSLGRDGTLGAPKTSAGRRVVPLGDDLVELLARVIDAGASPETYVFHAKGKPSQPLSYHNVRLRGFEPARQLAGLPETVTLHSLRSAAVSLLAAQGLTLVEVASVVGHADSMVTARSYAEVFESDALAQKVRAAQDSLRSAA